MAADDKKYVVFNGESMKSFAEQSGFSDVSDDVLMLLNEDVNYRLRELIRNSTQFMKHSRRKKLTCLDINRALKWSDTPPIYGHGVNCEAIDLYRPVDEQVFVPDDPEVDIGLYAEQIIQTNNLLDLKVNNRSISMKWVNTSGNKSSSNLLDSFKN